VTSATTHLFVHLGWEFERDRQFFDTVKEMKLVSTQDLKRLGLDSGD
jgi:hypothetical protein